jgi:pilus assembly protein CpaE
MAALNLKSLGAKAKPASAGDSAFVAAVIDETTREMVRGVARQLGWAAPVIREGGVSAAAAYVKATGAPAFLVVDVGDSEDPETDLTALLNLCGEPTPLVAIGLVNDVRLYRRLRDIGVADYLVKPVAGEVLAAALQGATQPQAAPRTEAKSTQVIALVGARGGVGATSLAVSTGWAIAERNVKVALLDLDLHFGSAALSLDLEPSRGLRELLTYPDRIDSLLIDAAATHAGERLRLLSAEEPLEDPIDIGPDGLMAIVDQLKSVSGMVVADVPRSLGPLTRQMMTCADVIGVVTDLSLAGMRDTQRLMTMITNAHGEAKAMIIANRVGGVAGEVAVSDFERGIGAKIAHLIPYDRQAAVAAAEAAKPLVEVAKNPKTVAALRGLALGFAGADVSRPSSSSLLKRVLGR